MSNVTYTVPNKNGSYDGDIVLKQYTSMTINNGDTVTVDQPCRGLFIYVTGNCTINGTANCVDCDTGFALNISTGACVGKLYYGIEHTTCNFCTIYQS